MTTNSKKTCTIYVIQGKDDFLVNKNCQQLTDQLLSEDDKQMGLLAMDPDKTIAAELFDELRTLPFLASKKVVLLKNADKFVTANRELLEKYFDSPSNSGTLIMTVKTWLKTTKLAKKLKSIGQLIAVEEIKKSYQLADFIVNYARENHKKKLSKDLATMIVELTGDDTGRLTSEIDKLATYINDRDKITAEDISAIVGNNRFFDAFNVINAMANGNAEQSIGRLRRMFASDKSAEYTVVGAFAYHFRQMFNAKCMLEKGLNIAQVAKECRIWQDKDGFFRRLKKLRLEQLGKIMSQLARIDHENKTGKTTIRTEMELLVVKVALVNSRR